MGYIDYIGRRKRWRRRRRRRESRRKRWRKRGPTKEIKIFTEMNEENRLTK